MPICHIVPVARAYPPPLKLGRGKMNLIFRLRFVTKSPMFTPKPRDVRPKSRDIPAIPCLNQGTEGLCTKLLYGVRDFPASGSLMSQEYPAPRLCLSAVFLWSSWDMCETMIHTQKGQTSIFPLARSQKLVGMKVWLLNRRTYYSESLLVMSAVESLEKPLCQSAKRMNKTFSHKISPRPSTRRNGMSL